MTEEASGTDRTLVVILIVVMVFLGVGGVLDHFNQRSQLKHGVVVSLRTSCKQAAALARVATRDRKLTKKQTKRFNQFFKDYYAPLNDALEDLDLPKCKVPHLPKEVKK